MKYNGFYVKISPDTDLHREDKDGNDIRCEGFTIEVFADESEKLEIDVFSVGSVMEVDDFFSFLWLVFSVLKMPDFLGNS